jgi:hypothetical protein
MTRALYIRVWVTICTFDGKNSGWLSPSGVACFVMPVQTANPRTLKLCTCLLSARTKMTLNSALKKRWTFWQKLLCMHRSGGDVCFDQGNNFSECPTQKKLWAFVRFSGTHWIFQILPRSYGCRIISGRARFSPVNIKWTFFELVVCQCRALSAESWHCRVQHIGNVYLNTPCVFNRCGQTTEQITVST